MVNTKELRCMDCGGFALDGGSIFFGAFKVENGWAKLGAICELCTLRRLARRGEFVNSSSSECCQVELPHLGIRKQQLDVPWKR
jgi:hypothetical protein